MSDHFQNFNNLYANLAQSSYPNQPIKFPMEALEVDDQNRLNSGQSVPFDFSKDLEYDGTLIPGGKNLGDDAVVYLQPDPTHTATKMTTVTVPKANGGYEEQTYVSKRYKKGLLTDEDAGFNAYFLTSLKEDNLLSWEGLFFML